MKLDGAFFIAYCISRLSGGRREDGGGGEGKSKIDFISNC